jgi:hypothetical protein
MCTERRQFRSQDRLEAPRAGGEEFFHPESVNGEQ